MGEDAVMELRGMQASVGSVDFKSGFLKEFFSSHHEACAKIKSRKGIN